MQQTGLARPWLLGVVGEEGRRREKLRPGYEETWQTEAGRRESSILVCPFLYPHRRPKSRMKIWEGVQLKVFVIKCVFYPYFASVYIFEISNPLENGFFYTSTRILLNNSVLYQNEGNADMLQQSHSSHTRNIRSFAPMTWVLFTSLILQLHLSPLWSRDENGTRNGGNFHPPTLRNACALGFFAYARPHASSSPIDTVYN